MALTLNEHPLREDLVLELHARPYEPLHPPEQASHLAVVTGEQGGDESREHLAALCQHYGAPPPAEGASFYSQDLGPFRVRWELHTEFCTYTFFRQAPFDAPFEEPVIGLVPAEWLGRLPGQVLGAVHLAFESREAPERSAEERARLFGGNAVIGSRVAGGAAYAWSDMRMHGDRFSRVLIRDVSLSGRQAGRLAQRLLEINTYRLMALLALPPAREASPRIYQADRRLADIAARMADSRDESTDADLLAELSHLAGEIEEMAAHTSYRFGAASAYHAIVTQRLRELRQERIQGLQTFSEFLERRLAPAMRTCEATAERQEALSQRAARITSLLRARVEVGLEEQNRDLLGSMDRRARLQLRLQETVEGLSVVAISYYLVGLVGYVLKGLDATGMPLDAAQGMGLAVPVVALLAWFGLKRARKRLQDV